MKKDNLLFVTNTDSDDISVVSTEAQTEIARINVGGSPRGSVRFDLSKRFGYVSNCAGNTISVIDLNNFAEVSKIIVGQAPRGIGIASEENIAFISNSGSDTLSLVDLETREQLAEISIGKNPRQMAVSNLLKRVIVSEWGSDSVSVFDINPGSKSQPAVLRSTISVGKDAKPYSVAINNGGTKAYVANTKADYMSVIDIKEEKETNRIKVGYGGRAIAVTPDDKFGFITTENTNEVAVIDLEKEVVINKVAVGHSPRGIVLDKISMKLYTADFERAGGNPGLFGLRDALTVVDVSNPTDAKAIGQIKVGLGPCSVSLLEK